jgi:uncharacterized protein (DUF433 family)
MHFPEDAAVRLTGLSKQRLGVWRTMGLYRPAISVDGVHLYSFRDLVSLRVLRELANKLRPGELKRIGVELRRFDADPWATMQFSSDGREVTFKNPETGKNESMAFARQIVPGALVSLKRITAAVKRDAEKMSTRAKADHGKLTRTRGVLHNSQVFAGTRIPVKLVQELHADGVSTVEICEQYPTLTAKDVRAALRAS